MRLKKPEFPRVQECFECGGTGENYRPCAACKAAGMAWNNCWVDVCPSCEGHGYVVPQDWVGP